MENGIYVVSLFDGDKGIMMAGTKDADGRVTPLAVERRAGLVQGTIANGVITVNEETRKMVNDLTQCLVNRLSNHFDNSVSINGIYMGIMPRSMRSVKTFSELTLDTRRRITDGDINELSRNAKAEASANGELVATYNCGFVKDNSPMTHVVGEIAKKLRMNNLSVVVGRRFIPDYKGLMPKSVSLMGVMPLSVAVGNVVTTPDDRFDGVLSIHFCADTTLFTAYVDDMVIATCVVPFGENDLIHDLCSIYFHDPKVWRRIYDNWDFDNGVKVKIKDSATGTTRTMQDDDVSKMLDAAKVRLQEIVSIGIDWMREQVEDDFERIFRKVVLTGALTEKNGFLGCASAILPESDCRKGDASMVLDNDDYLDDSDYLPLIGMIQMTTENCVEQKAVEEKPIEQPKPEPEKSKKKISIFSKMGQGILNFGEDDSTL